MVQWKVKRKKKVEKKLLETPGLEPDLKIGSQVRYRYTKTFPIAITRKRKMEFSNPTLQVKYEHDPGIWSKNKVHTGDSWIVSATTYPKLSENKAKTTEILLAKDGNVESSFEK